MLKWVDTNTLGRNLLINWINISAIYLDKEHMQYWSLAEVPGVAPEI